MRQLGRRFLRALRSTSRRLSLPTLLVLVVLLAGGILGLRGRADLLAAPGSLSWRTIGPILVGLLLLVGIVSFVVALTGARGQSTPGPPRPPKKLRTQLLGGALAVAIAYYVIRALNLQPATDPARSQADAGTGNAGPGGLSPQLLVVVGVMLAALAVTMVMLLRRPPEVAEEAPAPPQTLAAQAQAAVAAGRRALLEPGSAREAVIACYAAMETALTESGVERRHTDTPAEFLDRTASSGLLTRSGVEAAGRLADLFRRARFSARELPAAAVPQAEAALGRLDTEFEVLARPGPVLT